MRYAVASLILTLGFCMANGQAPPMPPSVEVNVPGDPFTAVPSPDGEWLFVALLGEGKSGIAALHREAQGWKEKKVVEVKPGIAGLAITHDGKMLIGAALDSIAEFDVAALEDPSAKAESVKVKTSGDEAVYVAVSPDDHYVFVSLEGSSALEVFDLQKAKGRNLQSTDSLGRIPVGLGPVGLDFSPDGRWLFSTSEVAPKDYKWPGEFAHEGAKDSAKTVPAGVLTVIDVAKIGADLAHAVVNKFPAGASPVRLIVSPDGKFVYVTERGSNAVGIFPSAELISDPAKVSPTTAKVGAAPVGIALTKDGKYLFAANSNRFEGANQPQTVSVIDLAKPELGPILTIPAGKFPREMRLSSDGKTLFLTNYSSETVQVIDLSGWFPKAVYSSPAKTSARRR